MKVCHACKKELPPERFCRNIRKPDGLNHVCRECAGKQYVAAYRKNKEVKAKSSKDWYEANKNRKTAAKKKLDAERGYSSVNVHTWKSYGLDPEEYFEMYHAQGGVCKICKQTCSNKWLAVDHCHATGRVRGLLCKMCNLGLGNFKDNVESLKSAIDYLKEPE